MQRCQYERDLQLLPLGIENLEIEFAHSYSTSTLSERFKGSDPQTYIVRAGDQTVLSLVSGRGAEGWARL